MQVITHIFNILAGESPSAGFVYTGAGAKPPSGIIKQGARGHASGGVDGRVSFNTVALDSHGGERPLFSASGESFGIRYVYVMCIYIICVYNMYEY